jgi:hypothetical protein
MRRGTRGKRLNSAKSNVLYANRLKSFSKPQIFKIAGCRKRIDGTRFSRIIGGRGVALVVLVSVCERCLGDYGSFFNVINEISIEKTNRLKMGWIQKISLYFMCLISISFASGFGLYFMHLNDVEKVTFLIVKEIQEKYQSRSKLIEVSSSLNGVKDSVEYELADPALLDEISEAVSRNSVDKRDFWVVVTNFANGEFVRQKVPFTSCGNGDCRIGRPESASSKEGREYCEYSERIIFSYGLRSRIRTSICKNYDNEIIGSISRWKLIGFMDNIFESVFDVNKNYDGVKVATLNFVTGYSCSRWGNSNGRSDC